MMGIDIKPVSPVLGALVAGVDLAKPLDASSAVALRAAFDEHSMVLIRGQSLTEAQLSRAVSWLGQINRRNRPDDKRMESDPYISKVSNIRENGRLIGSLPDGELLFHFDSAYVEVPQKATFLYAVEIPREGGNTRFANAYMAYDLVPAKLKRRLEAHTALQVYDYTTVEKPDVDKGLDNIKHFSHPIFVRHPITGRRALYVSKLMTARINGLERAESNHILEELFACSEHPSIVYEHVWQVGDFVAWDNLCSSHARTDFSAAERRLLLRGVIKGEHRPAA
jgi:taurine dioxygenase